MTTDITDIVLDHKVQDGFYSYENGALNFAPNFVQWPDKELIQRANKDSYSYPYRGYYWFNTRKEAMNFFQIKQDPDIDPTLPDISQTFMPDVRTDKLGPYPREVEFVERPDPMVRHNMIAPVEYFVDNPPAKADDYEEEDPVRKTEER